jgi:YVTN family beta-propeller protein
VANHDDGTVARIDPVTNQVIGTIDVGGQPFDMVVGFDALWVADEARDSVTRIDPRTNRTIATIPVGRRPNGLAIGEGSVWVANVLGHTVSRIDPTANRVVTDIKIGLLNCCPVHDVEVAGGMVWAIGFGAIQRIDPKTNQWMTPPVVLGGPPGFETYRAVFGEGSIWATETSSGTLSRLDPETRKFVKTPILIGGAPTFVTVGGGAVWITDQAGGVILRLDR